MKKIIAMMLSTVLFLSACNGATTPTDSTTQPATDPPTEQNDTDETVEDETTEEPGEEDPSEEDPSESTGDVITSTDFEHTFPIVDETVTYTAVSANENTTTGKWNEYWEDATNVHIDWTYWPATDFDVHYATTMAGDLLPNLFFLSGRDKASAYDAGDAGTFVDYRDYLEYMPYMLEMMEEFPEAWPAVQNDDGSIYGLPHIYMTLTAAPGTIYYRTDMMEEAGLEVPTTTDEFLQFVNDVQDYYSEDNDEFIAFQVWSSTHMNFIEYFFFPAFGEHIDPGFAANDDGEVVYNFTSEQYRLFLEFANELYESDGFDKNIYTEDGTGSRARMLENNAMLSTYATIYSLDNFESGNYDVDLLAPVTSEHFGEQQYKTPDVVRYGFMHIASDTEDIETLVKWVDSLYAKRENEIAEGIWAITPWLGKEGTDWEYTDEEQGFYQITPPEDWTESPTAFLTTIGGQNGLGYGYFDGLNTENEGLKVKGEGTRDNLLPYGRSGYPASYLNFTPEETRTIAEIYPDVTNHIETEKAKFISGQRDLSEFDTFVTEIERMGIDELLTIHQAAYDRYIESMDQIDG